MEKWMEFFIVDLDHSDIETEEDFERFLRGELPEEPLQERPARIKVSEILRYEQSFADSKWTDVFLEDGDILTVSMDYLTFKIQHLEATGELEQETFKDLKSLDSKVKIRYYLN